MSDILDKAGWRSESTFAKFNDKTIVEDILPIKFWSKISHGPSVGDKVELKNWTTLTRSWSSTGIPVVTNTEGLRALP